MGSSGTSWRLLMFLQWLMLPGVFDDGVGDFSAFLDGEGVTNDTFGIEHFSLDSVIGDCDEAGAMIEDDTTHDRVGARASVTGAAMTCNNGDVAVVWLQPLALAVGSVACWVSVAIVEDDSFGDRGSLIGSVNEHGALVNVGVSGEDKVYTATFENGHDMLAHFDELAFAI